MDKRGILKRLCAGVLAAILTLSTAFITDTPVIAQAAQSVGNVTYTDDTAETPNPLLRSQRTALSTAPDAVTQPDSGDATDPASGDSTTSGDAASGSTDPASVDTTTPGTTDHASGDGTTLGGDPADPSADPATVIDDTDPIDPDDDADLDDDDADDEDPDADLDTDDDALTDADSDADAKDNTSTDSSVTIDNITITTHAIAEGDDILSGYYALTGDDEYTWSYADSASHVIVRVSDAAADTTGTDDATNADTASDAADDDDTAIDSPDDIITTLDIYTECGYTYESPITIGDCEISAPAWLTHESLSADDLAALVAVYASAPADTDDETPAADIAPEIRALYESYRADYLGAIEYIDGTPYVRFTVSLTADDLGIDTYTDRTSDGSNRGPVSYDNLTVDLGVRIRPVYEDESFISIFRWSTDPADAAEDYYLGDVYLSLISLTMPEGVDDGRTYDLTDPDVIAATQARAEAAAAAAASTSPADSDQSGTDASAAATAVADSAASVIPNYMSYTRTDGEYSTGTLIMPKASGLTMKLLPKHGYQVTGFGLDESVVTSDNDENSQISAEADPADTDSAEGVQALPADTDAYADDAATGRYMLTAAKTVFHPAPTLSESSDTVITDDAESVVSGEIEIAAPDDETACDFPGSARLEVIDVPEDGEGALTDEQIEAFEQAASEASETGDAGEILGYLDISLYSVVVKAQGQSADADSADGADDALVGDETADGDAQADEAQEVWETEIKNPETPVTVTLNLDLDPETETEGLQVLHQKEVIVDDEVTYEYEVVPSAYNAEDQTVTFEAESFSVYALSITGTYQIWIEATIKGENVRRPANTIDQAIAFITSKTGFNGFKGEYRMFLGQSPGQPYMMTNDITLPSCVTKFVIVPFHEPSSDPRQYMSMITMNGKTFKSNAPVVIDGAVIFDSSSDGGQLTVPSLELTRLSALVVGKLTVSGTTTLNGGSYLLIDGDTTLGAVKVYEDYELNDSGVADKTKPLKKPAIYRHRNAVLNINGAITAGNENAGLRMGISAVPYWTVSGMIDPTDTKYTYTNTQDHAFSCTVTKDIDVTEGLVFYTTQKSVPGFISVEDSTKTAVYLDTAKKAVYAGVPMYILEKCTLKADGTVNEAQTKTLAQYVKYPDAATGVSALNDAEATYRLNIYEDLSDSDDPQVIAFPKKAQKMIYRSAKPSGASLKYTTSTKLPCDVTFEDLELYISDKNGKQLSPYTVATIDIAGHRLDFDGAKVSFSSPITFNDSAKKGTFRIDDGTRVVTNSTSSKQVGTYGVSPDLVNHLDVACGLSSTPVYLKEKSDDPRVDDPRANFDLKGSNVSIIAGSFNNIGTVIIPDGNIIVMADYQTKKDAWSAPTFTANTLDNYGQLWMVTENSDGTAKGTAKATVTSCHMHGATGNNELKADAVSITNLYLMGNAWVESRGAFDVTNLTSFTSDATLATMQNPNYKGAPNTPFLNVSGTVILQDSTDRVSVYVKYKEKTDGKVYTATLEKQSDDTKYPSGSMALLTTKNGAEDQFVPYHSIKNTSSNTSKNNVTNVPEKCWWNGSAAFGTKVTGNGTDSAAFSSENSDGYFLKKTGTTIHLYQGADARIAVLQIPEGKNAISPQDYDGGKTALEQACESTSYATIIGYYPAWADAVAAVNSLKTPAHYEFIVIKDIGSDITDTPADPARPNKPISMTFPSSGNITKLTITGNTDREDKPHNRILYTNALTLTCDTLFQYVDIAPVAYYKAGSKVKYPTKDGTTQQFTVNVNTYANASQPIKAGQYNLDLCSEQAVVTENLALAAGDEGKYILSNAYVPWIGAVSGNGKNTLLYSVYSDSARGGYPIINGSITNFKLVTVNFLGGLECAGDINVTDIVSGHLVVYGKNLKADSVQTSYMKAPKAAVNVKDLSVGFTSTGVTATMASLTSNTVSICGGSGTLDVTGAVKVKEITIQVTTATIGGAFTADSATINKDFTVSGTTDVKNLYIPKDATATLKGEVKITDTLNLGVVTSGDGGNACLDARANGGKPVTIKNIINKDSGNKISYTSNKKTSTLTISGTVTGITDTKKLGLEYYPDEAIATANLVPTVSDTPSTAKSDAVHKVTFTATSLIANIGTIPTDVFTVNVNRSGFTGNTLIKYSKGLYMPVDTSTEGKVRLQRRYSGEWFNSYYADWSQAITEINNINDKDATYSLILLSPQLDDTVITDGDPHGALSFPGKDKMKSLTVEGCSPSFRSVLYYAGSVTGYNKIVFEGVYLYSLPGNKSVIYNERGKGKGNFTFDELTLSIATVDTESDFKVNHMEVLSQSDINFKKNATITDLILNGNKNAVVFYGNATITNLTANSNKGSKGITFKAKATITNLNLTRSDVCFESNADITNLTTDNSSVAPGTAVNSVITATTKNLTGPSLLNIKGTVTDIAFIRLRVPVTRTDASGKKYTEYVFLENAEGYSALSYVGRQLALAPVADAVSFYAYGLFVDSETGKVKSDTTHVSYKDGSKYVINDNLDYMLVKVEDVTMGAENAKLVTYARTWNDAVSYINNANNKNVNYRITFLKKGVWRPNAVVCEAAITDKKNQVVGSYTGTEGYDDTNNIATAAYGKSDVASLTWPKASAANCIEITGPADTTLIYKGTFAPSVDCMIAGNIDLTTTQKDTDKSSANYNKFVPAYTTTVTIANEKNLEFEKTPGWRYFSSVTGSKGSITLPKNVKISGDLNVGSIVTYDDKSDSWGTAIVGGKTTAGELKLGAFYRFECTKDVNISTLNISNGAKMRLDESANGKLTIGTVNMLDPKSTQIYGSGNTVTIKDIVKDPSCTGTPTLVIGYHFTAPSTKAAGKTQLTINGQITGVKVHLCPFREGDDDGIPGEVLRSKLCYDSAWEPGKLVAGSSKTWNTDGWYDRKLVNMPKAAIADMTVENGLALELAKCGSGVYLVIDPDALSQSILVEGFSNATWNDTYKTYEGTFFSYDEAIKEIDRIGSKTENTPNSCVRITLQKDLGTESDPVKALPLPANVREFKLTGGTAPRHIYTTVTTLQVKAHATFENLEIDPRAMSKGSRVYDSYTTYSIAAGKNNVALKNCVTKTTYGTKFVKDITCASLTTEPTTDLYMTGKIQASEDVTIHGNLDTTSVTAGGLFTFYPSTMKSVSVAGNVSAGSLYIYNRSMGVDGTVNVKNKIRIDRETSGGFPVLRVKGAVTAGDLIVLNAGTLQTLRDLTVNNASISGAHHFDYPDTWEGSSVVAGNITVKQTATLDGRSTLYAGTAYVGDGNKTVENKAKDGKITIKDVIVSRDYDADEPGALLSVKRAASNNAGVPGASQLNITGTVTCTTPISAGENSKEPIQIGVRENTAGGGGTGGGDVIFTNNAEFTDGMLLVTAPMASDRYFRPSDSMKEAAVNESSTLKTGKIVKKGTGIILTSASPEVSLREFRTVLPATGPKAKTATDVNGDGVIDRYDGDQYVPGSDVPETEFATYEDAVNQINTYNRYKMLDDNDDGTPDRASQYFEDYTIFFNHSCDVQNAKGDYVALPLPTKVGALTFSCLNGYGADVRFSGGVTLKSHLELSDCVSLVPQAYDKTAKNYKATASAVNLGSYRLRMSVADEDYFDADYYPEYEPIYPSSITGSKGSRLELITGDPDISKGYEGGFIAVRCTGNISVPYVAIQPYTDNPASGVESTCTLAANGNVTITDLYTDSNYSETRAYLNVGGTGTFTNIHTDDSAYTVITEQTGKPIKVNGVVNGESSETIHLVMNTTNVSAGTVYATGSKLKGSDWTLHDNAGNKYAAYMNGSNLLRGRVK